MRRNLLALILGMIVLVSVSLLEAPDILAEGLSAQADDQSWSFVLYNNNNGMPFSEANDLQQTSDGFIYVGCYGGLLRFDGEAFFRFEDARLINVINLYVDSRDRLWIATNSNGFSIMENGGFTFYDEEKLDSLNIRCFQEDADGRVLIGTSTGMYYMTPDGQLRVYSDPAIEGSGVEMLFSDGKGKIYGLIPNGSIFVMENLEITSWFERETFSKDSVTSIYPDPENENCLFMGLASGGILYGNPWTQQDSLQHFDTPDLNTITAMLYSDGRLWIASDKGIAFYNENGEYVRPDKMQRSNAAQSLMADMEGNIWAASYRLGIIKMSPSIFTNINSLANLPAVVVNATCLKDDILYIGCDTGLICLDSDYNVVTTPVSEMLAHERIRCILEDREGCLWFCTFGNQGLVCMEEDGTCTNYTTETGFYSNYVRDIYEMRDGTLVVSIRGGLYYIRDKKIVESYEEDRLADDETLCMLEDREGRLLTGTNGSGIYFVKDGEVKMLPGTEKLSSSVILRMRYNERQDSLWILSGTALYILKDGKLTEIPDIPNLHNYDIIFDKDQNAWILAADGIYIGKADDILSGKSIRYTHYDYKRGLPYIVTPHCRNYLSEDGMLYMSGSDGVVRINLYQASEDNSNVQLIVPYIEADDETIHLTPGEKVVLPSGVRKLWVHPFALSYSLNEPVISYGLEGFDDRMQVANRSELPSFIYTNLKGGSYTFRFAVIDPATGEAYKEITVPIVKRKAFHEQIAFWILCAAAMAGLISLCVRLYLRKKTREMELEREQDRMKTELSVARDIQASVLPNVFPAFPGRREIDLYAVMSPAMEVAGDFYDFFLIDHDRLALVIADVSGKGVGAALFMMVSKNNIKSSALSRKFSGPGEILADVNEKLCEDNDANLFVTVWLGILTISTGRLVTANAGHEYPVLYRQGEGYILEKDKHGPALGIIEGAVYKEAEWRLERGDGIFVYTDGVPEATDAHEKLFGTDRMMAALDSCTDHSTEGMLRCVRKAVDAFVGDAPQFDDLTMLSLRYYGSTVELVGD